MSFNPFAWWPTVSETPEQMRDKMDQFREEHKDFRVPEQEQTLYGNYSPEEEWKAVKSYDMEWIHAALDGTGWVDQALIEFAHEELDKHIPKGNNKKRESSQQGGVCNGCRASHSS